MQIENRNSHIISYTIYEHNTVISVSSKIPQVFSNFSKKQINFQQDIIVLKKSTLTYVR